jgi:CheY-like chemotaxis protein
VLRGWFDDGWHDYLFQGDRYTKVEEWGTRLREVEPFPIWPPLRVHALRGNEEERGEGAWARGTRRHPGRASSVNRCVLLLEDADDIREPLTELLITQGYSTIGVRTARAGLALLQGGLRPRVLVLDPFTPNGSSAFLTELTANPAWVSTPAIVGWGAGDAPEPAANALLRRYYLRKPLDLRDLFRALDRYLGGPSAGATTEGVRRKSPSAPPI